MYLNKDIFKTLINNKFGHKITFGRYTCVYTYDGFNIRVELRMNKKQVGIIIILDKFKKKNDRQKNSSARSTARIAVAFMRSSEN